MRVLYSHRTRSADGQSVHIRALTQALRARGHHVLVSGPQGSSLEGALDAQAGEGGFRARLPRPLHELAELIYSVPGYLQLEADARALSPDVVYERYNLFYHSGAHLARARRLPFLLEVNAPLAEERARHGGLALEQLAQRSQRQLWRSADAIFAVTGVLARMIEKSGAAPEGIHVVANGVDAEFLAEADPRLVRARFGLENKIVLGFAGFLRDWHRLDLAVEYLKTRGRDDFHLLIVGDGPARAGLERAIAAAGVQHRVTFAGVVQREAMPAHVAAFDIALQPAAVAYASPLKLFEYMAQARAIVAPNQPNIGECLSAGVDALLFSPEEPSEFTKALDALAFDPALRARLGRSARSTLDARDFTWAGAARRVETVARNLLEKQA